MRGRPGLRLRPPSRCRHQRTRRQRVTVAGWDDVERVAPVREEAREEAPEQAVVAAQAAPGCPPTLIHHQLVAERDVFHEHIDACLKALSHSGPPAIVGARHGRILEADGILAPHDQANGRVAALSRLGADPEAVQRDALATIGALDPGSLEFPPDVAREREAIRLPLGRFPANAPLGRMLTIEGRDVMRVAGDVAERRTGGKVAPTLTNEDLLYGLVASSASLASVVLERHGCGMDQLIGALGEDWRRANASARATRKRRGRPSPLAGLVARVDELSARVAELEGRLE